MGHPIGATGAVLTTKILHELERADLDGTFLSPDGSVSEENSAAVVAAQAWHWVDPARAIPELARVLAESGRLAPARADR